MRYINTVIMNFYKIKKDRLFRTSRVKIVKIQWLKFLFEGNFSSCLEKAFIQLRSCVFFPTVSFNTNKYLSYQT